MKNKRAVWYDQLADNPILNPLYVTTSERGLVAIAFNMSERDFLDSTRQRLAVKPVHAPAQVKTAALQLHQYLRRERTAFTIPLDLGTATRFQMQVMTAILSVPYGEVRSYGYIAAQIDQPLAARAVGQANARNLLPIVIPCHRIISSNGTLGGYCASRRMGTKRQLLQLEGALGMNEEKFIVD